MEYLGIDFGMENLKVSYNNGKSIRNLNIASKQGISVTPNVVYYEKNEEGEIKKYFGASKETQTAKKICSPDYISHIKRKMQLPEWSQTICENSMTVTSEDVAADIFKFISEQAYINIRKAVPAVITVPVMFSEVQKNKIKSCAEKAGISVEEIITEPFAALFSPEIIESLEDCDDEKYIVVFDFGGSTLDICLVKAETDNNDILNITLLSSGGMQFGGVDITEIIKEELVKPKLQNILPDINKDSRTIEFELYNIAEELKQALYEETDYEDAENAYEGELINISKKEVEKLLDAKGIKDKIIEIFDDIFESVDEGVEPDEVEEIYTIGGTSKITYFQDIISNYFGKDSVGDTEDESYVYNSVSDGAAKYIAESEKYNIKNSMPLAVGIEKDGRYKRALNKNSMYSEKGQRIEISYDYLSLNNWEIKVYQSISDKPLQDIDSQDIYYAGKFIINKNSCSVGHSIYISVNCDKNGIYAKIENVNENGDINESESVRLQF